MIEIFATIFTGIFGSYSWLATLIISMFPIIELKGAIPVGMSVEFWGEYALNNTEAFVFSLIGSCLVVPILALVFKPIIKWMKDTKIFRSIAEFIDKKVIKSASKIDHKLTNTTQRKKTVLKFFGVLAFVAIPLPLTGVWTGTCIGVVIGLRFWQTVLAVIVGNIIAGFLVTCVCSVFPAFTSIIFFVVLAIVIILLIYWIIKSIVQSKKEKREM